MTKRLSENKAATFSSFRAREPRSLARMFEFYISGPITGPEDYIDDFDVIRNAGPDDVIKLYINSGGGYMDTAIQYMRVLAETEATVVASIEGNCCSAATMIFLCADQYEITPFSSFMIHNYSGGTFGKGGNMHEQIQYERKWSEALLREIYSNFLNEAEIVSVLDGKDLWLSVEEVADRMEKRNKALEELIRLEQETKPD